MSVEPVAVVRFIIYPVPVLFVVSVKLKRLVVEVVALYVNVLVFAAIVSAIAPVGLVRLFQDDAPALARRSLFEDPL